MLAKFDKAAEELTNKIIEGRIRDDERDRFDFLPRLKIVGFIHTSELVGFLLESL